MSALYKAFKVGKPVFFGLALGILLASGPAQANSYTIEGVVVDVIATNAVKAREEALVKAQVKAFEQLATQNLTPEARAAYTMPDADTIMALVQDFEVTNEQLSTKRYKGTFTVRFRPALAQQYLNAPPVTAQQTAPAAVLGQTGTVATAQAPQPMANPNAPYQPPRPAAAYVPPAYQAPAAQAVTGRAVNIRARFAGVQEWVRLKNVLERNRSFGMRRVISLQPTEALVELAFNGTPGDLQNALSAAGLVVSPAQSVVVNEQAPLFDVGFGGYSRY